MADSCWVSGEWGGSICDQSIIGILVFILKLEADQSARWPHGWVAAGCGFARGCLDFTTKEYLWTK